MKNNIFVLLALLLFQCQNRGNQTGIEGNNNSSNTIVSGNNNVIAEREDIYINRTISEQLRILYNKKSDLNKNYLAEFLQRNKFNCSDDNQYSICYIDYTNTYDPSPSVRIALAFKNNKLIAVIHNPSEEIDLNSQSTSFKGYRLIMVNVYSTDETMSDVEEMFKEWAFES